MSDIGKDWPAALAWGKNIDETAQRLHDDLQRHDQADFRNSIAKLDPVDMSSVSGSFSGRYDKGLKQSVQDDASFSAADKSAMISAIDGNNAQAVQTDTNPLATPQFRYSQILAGLSQDMIGIYFSEGLAQSAADRAAMARELDFHIPFIFDHRAQSEADLKQAQQDGQSANDAIIRQVGSCSSDQIKAIEQLSSDSGGQGLFKKLLADQNLSPETRAFIKDRVEKAGLSL